MTELDLSRIGGSDVPDVLGLPGRSPLRPWGRIVLGLTSESNEVMDWGTELEAAVARVMAARRGISIHKPPSLVSARNWQRVSLDGLVEQEQDAIVEVKLRRSKDGWGEPGTDQVAEDVQAQVQTYLEATGRKRAYVWVLFGGQEGLEYVVPARPRLGELIVARCERFWREHILTKIPPRWDGSESAERVVRAMNPTSTKPIRWATAEEMDLAANYAGAERLVRLAETRRAELQQQLEASIGEARGIQGPFGKIHFGLAEDSEQTDWKKAVLFMASVMGWTEEQVASQLRALGFSKHVAGTRRFTPKLKKELLHGRNSVGEIGTGESADPRPHLADGIAGAGAGV